MFLLFTSRAHAGDEAKTIHLHTIYGWGAYTDSQYLQTFKALMTEVLKEEKKQGIFKHFEDEREFYRAIKTPGPNIIQVGNREQLSVAISKYGYKPFIAYEFLDEKKNKCCLYVRKDGPYTSVADLKGKTVTLSKNLIEYVSLRRLLGAKPEIFFSNVDVVGDGDAPAYEFYMTKPDAMWITVQQVRFLEISNPSL